MNVHRLKRFLDEGFCVKLCLSKVNGRSRFQKKKKRNLCFTHNLFFFEILGFFGKSKNARAEISRKTHRRMSRDLSYETDSGPKTKLENDPFSRPLKKLNNFLRLPKRNWVNFARSFHV